MSIVPIFSEGYSSAKLFIDYFSWPCELFKNAHACALRDCLGVSRPFVSDTSPKCIDREGLKRRRAGTRQGTLHVDKIQVRFKIVNITHALPVPVFHTETWDRFPFAWYRCQISYRSEILAPEQQPGWTDAGVIRAGMTSCAGIM